MTLSRKTFALAAIALSAAIGLAPGANAGPIHDLPSCYNHVIAVCNDTSNHPGACIDNATNACDEEFGNQAQGTLPKIFLAPSKPQRVGLLLPAVQAAREAAR